MAGRPVECQLGHRRRILSLVCRDRRYRNCMHILDAVCLAVDPRHRGISCSSLLLEDHRGVANSVITAGTALGPGFGMLIGGTLMARFGWRPFFIVLGLVSLLWLIPWLKWMPPARHA